MDDRELIEAVIGRARERGITHKRLSGDIGLSQPHVSKVLATKFKLAKKTQHALQEWLVVAPPQPDPPGTADLTPIMNRLKAFSPGMLMQFMQNVDIFEAISEFRPGMPSP